MLEVSAKEPVSVAQPYASNVPLQFPTKPRIERPGPDPKRATFAPIAVVPEIVGVREFEIAPVSDTRLEGIFAARLAAALVFSFSCLTLSTCGDVSVGQPDRAIKLRRVPPNL